MDETRATAELPTVTVDIRHREAEAGGAEVLTVTISARPNFRSAANLLEVSMPPLFGLAAMRPALLWTEAMQAAWRPWLQMAGFALPAPGPDALPEKAPVKAEKADG